MASQESEMDFNLNIYFIIASKYKSENDCSEDMWYAFNKCDDHELSPQWITEKNCAKLKPEKKDVFVMEEFEGNFFIELQKFKCSRIVGPRCLLSCFMTGEPIPEGTNPIFITAMRGLVVSASGFPSEIKEAIRQKVEYMGGVFTKQLRSSVTHLITDSVMSAKYERALELGIPIVTERWVTAVWESNLKEFIKATNDVFDEYKCPVFMNLIVTATNLPKRKKEEIKNLINDHGGVFMGALDGSKVKIVLAPENSTVSEKLKYAMQNNIACLKDEWVFKSVEKGYALPFNNFLITSTKACSTPERSQVHETFNFSGISVIPGDIDQNGFIDESAATTTCSTIEQFPVEQNGAPYVQVLERLSINEAKMAGPFLDGCNIYLAGFPPVHREKLNRILNVGSATRFNDISDAITHVLVGDASKALNELKLLQSKGLSPCILNIKWLEESIKLRHPATEDGFQYQWRQNESDKTMEAPSPLSKKNLQMLQCPKRLTIPFDIDKPRCSKNHVDEPDLVQQYLQKSVVVDKSVKEFLQPHDTTLMEQEQKTFVDNGNSNYPCTVQPTKPITRLSKDSDTANDSSIPITQSSDINEKILEGLTFILTGFDEQDNQLLTANITVLGGQIVPYSFKGIPDYGIVPLLGAPLKYTVSEIVTDLFIEDCIDQEKVVDIMYYHRPLSLNKDANPLAGCVIAMSSYTGKERAFLSQMVEALGGRYQDTFARKTNTERNTYGSTHLVCPTPKGDKYNAAVKWKLPAVTADWLKTCAAQQEFVDETPYLVGETIATERPKSTDPTPLKTPNPIEVEQMKPPTTPALRQILTPKRHLQHLQNQNTSGGETPLINRRLSLGLNKTPQSPFHVSTPETPYGQVFKSNPSPDTRKGWIKWVENLPDLRVQEPPLKRRAPSTPLSELKRQLWEKLKEPIDQKGEEANDELVAKIQYRSPLTTPKATEDTNQHNVSLTSNISINKRLSYTDDNSPIQKNEINIQLAQLDQVLQAPANTSENRHSLSAENVKIYNLEPTDQIAKCMVKDSQPDTVGWEDPGQCISTRPSTINEEAENEDMDKETKVVTDEPFTEDAIRIPPKPKFMLSGVKDRLMYEEVIKALGGDVSTETNFDITATHLLCIRPSRNEKMLGSIAAGKWVLHYIYLRDCEQEGKFLDEEKYEWGNPKSNGVIPDLTGETENLIAAAAYRWRLKLLKEPRGAFHGMVALLIVLKEKYDQFQRLICAGGGVVVQARPPYDSNSTGKKITHCFIQLRQLDQPVDWAMMASKGILCFLPQYLSEYLTAETPLNPRDCVLPEFKKYLTLLPK